MADPILVYRVKDYGGGMYDSPNGGYGTEFYAVHGVAWEEKETAHVNGLPRPSFYHPDPRFRFVGPCRSVGPHISWGPLDWLAKVEYSVNGSLGFSTRLGSRTTFEESSIRLPIFWKVPNVSPDQYRPKSTPTEFPRPIFTRIESRVWQDSTDTILALVNENVGKSYQFSQFWVPFAGLGAQSINNIYTLAGANVTTDAGNNTRIDTYFKSRPAIKAFAAGYWTGQDIAIPYLPANCWYDEYAGTGEIKIVDPFDLYGGGQALPWL